ncbi:apolipoprotein N-acyltransferase [Scytonema millei]|uniref:Apolipoprotein N-acyltransferase n=1 Tax=Scytonema millei VB511283 TaxID=1245923 RepID=A0A9X5E8N0_9CYAN|nr:apolipoprotein N-acyltransferase [Scytonema millei]NHC36936.1 apolipoprotein N-acyltransferase [Scytonema millei VB511283]
MGLSVAPVGAWYLAWIALAPLWVLVVTTPKHSSLLAPHSLPLLWGIGYHGVALFWITGIHPMTWMGVPWLSSLAIALFCWIFITLWGVALVATWSISMRALLNWKIPTFKSPLPNVKAQKTLCAFAPLRDKIPIHLIRLSIGVAFWCGLESLWSAGPLWWSSLSYTQSPHNLPILHLGQLSGASAVTAAIVAVNGLFAEAWIAVVGAHSRAPVQGSRKTLVLCLLPFTFCLLLHLLGYSLYSSPLAQPPDTALRVGIVQGNVPNKIKLYPEGFRKAIEGYTTGYQTLADRGVDAVLTPEGALPFRWHDVQRTSFYSAVKERGVVAWLGLFGDKEGGYTNSIFTLLSNGQIFSRYDKSKLVPIGEYVPFQEILGGIISRLSPLDEHQLAGAPNQLFDTPFGRAIVGICYESAFPERFRYQAAAGGQFILSPSNDAHYSAAMPAQHHALDIMRAIETDRWAVRAVNTGYSAFVDPHGKTVWISGHDTYETHAETIYRRQTKTLYVQWGDWLTPLSIAVAVVVWLVRLVGQV